MSASLCNLLLKESNISCQKLILTIFPRERTLKEDASVDELSDLLLSLTFQTAVCLCEKQGRVIFLTPRPLDKLPFPVEGCPRPSYDNMTFLKFYYPRSSDDLIQFFTSVHCWPSLPDAIFVSLLSDIVKEIDDDSSPSPDVMPSTLLPLIADTAAYITSRKKNFKLCVSSTVPYEVWAIRDLTCALLLNKNTDGVCQLEHKMSDKKVSRSTNQVTGSSNQVKMSNNQVTRSDRQVSSSKVNKSDVGRSESTGPLTRTISVTEGRLVLSSDK